MCRGHTTFAEGMRLHICERIVEIMFWMKEKPVRVSGLVEREIRQRGADPDGSAESSSGRKGRCGDSISFTVTDLGSVPASHELKQINLNTAAEIQKILYKIDHFFMRMRKNVWISPK